MKIVEVRLDVGTNRHLARHTVVAKKRLIVEWFDTRRAEVYSMAHRRWNENILGKFPSGIAPMRAARLYRQGIDTSIRSLGK